MSFICDASPHKQGHFMPGSRIPIVAPAEVESERPDTVVILPWNLKHEIADELDVVRSWNGRFAAAIPRMDVF
jgi:hypothetical protein